MVVPARSVSSRSIPTPTEAWMAIEDDIALPLDFMRFSVSSQNWSDVVPGGDDGQVGSRFADSDRAGSRSRDRDLLSLPDALNRLSPRLPSGSLAGEQPRREYPE